MSKTKKSLKSPNSNKTNKAEISSSSSPRAQESGAWIRPEDDVRDEEEDTLQDPPPHHYPDHLDWAERTQG